MSVVKRDKRKSKGKQADENQRINKQHGDVRQSVACLFHHVQKPVHGTHARPVVILVHVELP